MSMSDFQKYDPVWSYFSVDGYNSCLLKDFNIVDEETHDLFVQLLCQNRKISPPTKNTTMYVKEFDTRAYHLLQQDDFFRLLKEMALPLEMKHWQLNVAQTQYPAISLRQFIQNFSDENFKSDLSLRWKTYFSFVVGSIQDLKIPHPKQLREFFPNIEKIEQDNLQKAEVLENGLKDSLDSVGEYFFQKELIWYAKEDKLSNIYLRFSRLFDVTDKNLTSDEMLERELKALDIVDRAIVLTQTNDTKSKQKAFDIAYDVRKMLKFAQLKKVSKQKGVQDEFFNLYNNGDSHEKD